ncbi:hypothetical protein MASR2M8_18700 [Opitutaceae bacterium]
MSDTNAKITPRSLKDYVIRYDVKSLLKEALLDYGQAVSGAPRHLEQGEIAARFRKPSPPTREQP